MKDKTTFFTEMSHPEIITEIGQPAFGVKGMEYPQVKIYPAQEAEIEMKALHEGQKIAEQSSIKVKKGETEEFKFEGTLKEAGNYKIELKIDTDEKVVYDFFYFHIKDEEIFNQSKNLSEIVYLNENDELTYVSDYKGNRIPDFSYAGYKGGGVKIPEVPVKVTVEPGSGDDTKRIQEAIDEVSKMQVNENGFRGAVLLKEGNYSIKGIIQIKTSGIVLRGEGTKVDGTILTSTSKRKKTLIEICGKSGPEKIAVTEQSVTDIYVPVGARKFHINDASEFEIGDKIIVYRPSTKKWIHDIDMDNIIPRPGNPSSTKQWTAGSKDLYFDRVITDIDNNLITIDAPLTNSLEAKYGGGLIYKYNDHKRIKNVGIEYIKGITQFDKSIQEIRRGFKYYADEDHANNFVIFDDVKNAWARNLEFYHFINGIKINRGGKWITVQDCANYNMVSKITGGRRYPFNTSGELIMFQRNYSETARHAFCVGGSTTPGPNIFLNCNSRKNYNTSEPHHRWSTGGLYDNVRAPIAIQDREYYGSGHGWSGANYVAWNTEGMLICQKPPTAQNWAIGHKGEKKKGAFADDKPTLIMDGYWESLGKHVKPESLYLEQLENRIGEKAVGNIGYK